MPAKATNLEGLSKRLMSPNSLIMIAPRTGPIPGMVVIGELIFSINFLILCSQSLIWLSINFTCSINNFSWKVKLSLEKVTPKEFLAELINFSAVFWPIFFLISFSRVSVKTSTESSSKSAGEEKSKRSRLEVVPRVLENIVWYSGNTWSRTQIILRFKSPVDWTR